MNRPRRFHRQTKRSQNQKSHLGMAIERPPVTSTAEKLTNLVIAGHEERPDRRRIIPVRSSYKRILLYGGISPNRYAFKRVDRKYRAKLKKYFLNIFIRDRFSHLLNINSLETEYNFKRYLFLIYIAIKGNRYHHFFHIWSLFKSEKNLKNYINTKN